MHFWRSKKRHDRRPWWDIVGHVRDWKRLLDIIAEMS